ncbi:MAG TPA: threonine synthase [Steroidobacteraceae bacterium]
MSLSPSNSAIGYLECPRCETHYDADKLINICPCGSPLLARYDFAAAKVTLTKAALPGRTRSMWRYQELLPLRDNAYRASLNEGGTPLTMMPRLGRFLGVPELSLKDEGFNPGGTFKARGASCAVSRAAELGAKTLGISTNGNAGEALAAYAARAGLRAVVAMPVDAQDMAKRITAAAGARVIQVRGLISDGARIIQQGVADHGWFEVNTFREPYRLEGKKTMLFEIAEQSAWELPDAMVFPVGGGVAIYAAYKALRELQALGWIGHKLPRLIAVQASGCAPLVKAYEAGEQATEFCHGAHTEASGLRVPQSFGDFLVLEAIYQSRGAAVAVTDAEIRQGISDCMRLEGVLLCPESAALLPAVARLAACGMLRPEERVVMVATGNGLKYPRWLNEVPDDASEIDAIRK